MRILNDEKVVSAGLTGDQIFIIKTLFAGKFFQPGGNIVFGHENPIPS